MLPPQKRTRICIVAHFACGAITGGGRGHVGGVERQTTIMARWLAARGHAVSLLTWDEGVADGSYIDGVRLHTICRADAGLPILRFFHPRTTGLWSAMKRADADIYYHNCAEYFTGLIAYWCRRNGRRFVFSTAHDSHCDPDLPSLRKPYERILYRYGLRRADRVIVQTDRQREMLRRGFGCDGTVLPMACPGPSDANYSAPAFPKEPTVIWAARLVPQKCPERLLEIAERMPEIRFEVAGANAGSDPYVVELRERARRLPNLQWLGSVSRENMPSLYRRALCLCSTSDREGFPNTFLEAWSHGIPLVTTFDPDGLVQRLRLGFHAKNVAECVSGIRNLATDPLLWEELSRNARAHFRENYDVDASNSRFEQLFLDLSTANPAR